MSDMQQSDMLASIFAMQAELNNKVFRSNSCRGRDGDVLSMAAICREAQEGRLGVNDFPNEWLCKYGIAMDAELAELRAELLWKWWSKDTIDLQNIRVELVDILHFLVSSMICAGLTPEKLFDIYSQKHAINQARQDSNYSMTTKTEDDNRQIK